VPRLNRAPSNSVNDRPGRWKLLFRRQRRAAGRVGWIGLGGAALLGVAAFFRSGHAIEDLHRRIAATTGSLGFRVSAIDIVGRANTPEPLLRAALAVKRGDPILGFSPEHARERIEHLSWVKHATVERRLPGTIVVQLQERRPFAIWQNQGKFMLIDRVGQVVTDSNVADFRQLPLVVGPGAPEAAAALLDALTDRPALAGRVTAAVRVGERRWNLATKSGVTVMLPEGHEVAALDRFIALEHAHKLLERPLQFVDLRLPDRLVLRPRPDAAASAVKDPRAAPSDPKKAT
jgi:cell division protein FtsQ